MKTLLYKQRSILIMLLTLFYSSFIACKKTENSAQKAIPTPMGAISFHIHSNIDTSEVSLATPGVNTGKPVKDASGRNIQLDIAQFYISSVTLKKTDGTNCTVPGVYILKTIGQEDYLIGSLPAGNYTAVSFNVGIDPATNATTPSSYAASSVLSPQNPSMWFNATTQGFIFMNIQGKVDTSANNSGPINFPISYQIGGNDLLKTINLPARTLSIAANGNERIHLIVDYAKILKGINFKTQNKATPWPNNTLVAQMASNIPLMFRYEY
jgi:hypothetical protein